MLRLIRLFVLTIIQSAYVPSAISSDLIIHVSQLPGFADSEESGLLIDVLNYLDDSEPDIDLKIEVVPFTRAVESVVNNQADIQLPIIQSTEGKIFKLNYSERVLFNVPFAIYSNQNKIVNTNGFNDIDGSPDLKIETEASHLYMFKRALLPTVCIKCSIKKVALGRIDGLIYAEPIVDSFINKNNMMDIHKQTYKVYPAKYSFKPTIEGKKSAELLEGLFLSQKDNPTFVKVMKRLRVFDFQPASFSKD